MTIPVPPVPEFKDKTEQPLSDLELEIKKTIAQRNYDLEKYPPNRIQLDDSWLKSQETSIKKEKLGKLTKDSIRYISIDDKNLDNNILKKDIIELEKDDSFIFKKKEKHISWKKELDNNVNNLDEGQLQISAEDVFFNSLKVIPEKLKSNDLEKIELLQKVKGIESRLSKMELLIEKLLEQNKTK